MGYIFKKVKLFPKSFIFFLGLLFILIIKAYAYYQENHVTTPIAISEHPKIRLYPHFITKAEAEHLIKLARNRLIPSSTVMNGQAVYHPGRSSSTAVLFNSHDKVIKKIQEKACQLVNCKKSLIEALQVVHYYKGQQYTPHYDYFAPEDLIYPRRQRLHTFIIYLNTLDKKDGGATEFPSLGLKFQPQVGTAIYFRNQTENGVPDPLTLHAGSPVTGDNVEKWACNLWIQD